ncbi:hypothetical protein ALC60_11049 [Trachymyrmex zeteki]|uniref:Uncharacterized protein n=1 Tax=Mycetomoellerius zeteki TaxID=64791 RepID=A0A151WPT0_9HYME|nr:hypothetical protein ALC60_11049 [Trachymyrmex zeteki]
MVTLNDTLFRELFEKAEKKLPRMESVVSIIPPYKCIHKHLQRMNVFQEKTKKMVGLDNLSFATLTNPTDRAPSLFFSRLSLRMSPVVPVRTDAAQRVWLQPSVSTFDPPRIDCNRTTTTSDDTTTATTRPPPLPLTSPSAAATTEAPLIPEFSRGAPSCYPSVTLLSLCGGQRTRVHECLPAKCTQCCQMPEKEV